MPVVFYILLSLFVASVFVVLWMRQRMRASKSHFALTVVSTMLTCLFLGLSAMSSSLPASVASKISEAIGFGSVGSAVPSILILLLTITALLFIYQFGTVTIKNWDAPLRVSEVDLEEKFLNNSIAALTLEQLKRRCAYPQGAGPQQPEFPFWLNNWPRCTTNCITLDQDDIRQNDLKKKS